MAQPDLSSQKLRTAPSFRQGANIPCTLEAEEALQQRGVLALPDFITNAGGVSCAAFEYQGGTERAAFEHIDECIRANTLVMPRSGRQAGTHAHRISLAVFAAQCGFSATSTGADSCREISCLSMAGGIQKPHRKEKRDVGCRGDRDGRPQALRILPDRSRCSGCHNRGHPVFDPRVDDGRLAETGFTSHKPTPKLSTSVMLKGFHNPSRQMQNLVEVVRERGNDAHDHLLTSSAVPGCG